MTFNLVHRTIYHYASPVTVSHHAARVEPRVLPQQQVENFSLKIGPTPAVIKPRVIFSATRSAVSASRKFTGTSKSPRAAA